MPDREKKSLLDCASGPIQYPEYLEYSRAFAKRVCVDFSEEALKAAKTNLAMDSEDGCVAICADFLDIELPEKVDAAISLHTLYHVQLERQKEFVDKLIAATAPNGVIIVVYSNPLSLRSVMRVPVAAVTHVYRVVRSHWRGGAGKPSEIYCKRHRRGWWKQFEVHGRVSLSSYRFFTPPFEKAAIPDSKLGEWIYRTLFRIEETRLSVPFVDHYIVVIRKGSLGV